MKKHYLYRVRSHDEKVLYVGITDDLETRMNQHRRDSQWWKLRESIDFCIFSKRIYCKAYETYLINYYLPKFNKSEKDGHEVSDLPFNIEDLEWFPLEKINEQDIKNEIQKLDNKILKMKEVENDLRNEIIEMKKDFDKKESNYKVHLKIALEDCKNAERKILRILDNYDFMSILVFLTCTFTACSLSIIYHPSKEFYNEYIKDRTIEFFLDNHLFTIVVVTIIVSILYVFHTRIQNIKRLN